MSRNTEQEFFISSEQVFVPYFNFCLIYLMSHDVIIVTKVVFLI